MAGGWGCRVELCLSVFLCLSLSFSVSRCVSLCLSGCKGCDVVACATGLCVDNTGATVVRAHGQAGVRYLYGVLGRQAEGRRLLAFGLANTVSSVALKWRLRVHDENGVR